MAPLKRKAPDQDAPPEGNWLYRRSYVYGLSLTLTAILLTTILLTPREDLQAIAGWLIMLLALILIIYLIAPTAAELGKLIAALPVFRLGRAPSPPESDQ